MFTNLEDISFSAKDGNSGLARIVSVLNIDLPFPYSYIS